MKRDMDLIRKILFNLGDSEFYSDMGYPRIDGYNIDQIKHHVFIMRDAGLLRFTEGKTVDGFLDETEDLELRLTWEGHEFLEKVRDDKLWKSILDTTKKKTGGLSFDVLKALLIATLTKSVGL
jgi:hypothetical protein